MDIINKKNNIENIFSRKIVKYIAVVVICVIVWICIKFLGSLFSPFIIGYLLSLLLHPIFNILNKRYKVPAGVSGFICIFGFLLIVYMVGFRIFYQLFNEAKSLSENFPYYIKSVTNTIESLVSWLEGFKYNFFNILGVFPETIKLSFMQIIYNFQNVLIDFISNFVSHVSVESIKNIPQVFTTSIMAIISGYLFLIDKSNIQKFIKSKISSEYYEKLNIIKETTGNVISGYIKAQLIIMSIIMIICFIGLSIVKVPYSFLIAVIIGIIDALPVFGGGAILIPWAIYNFIIKNYHMASALISIYLVVFVIRQVVEPKVLGKQIGLHPLATLISVYVGFRLFGLIGLILAPMVLVIVITLVKEKIIEI